MNKSESIENLAKALAKAQGELGNAKKDSVNPHFRSKYADIAEVLDTIKPVFSKHGLSFVQIPGMNGDRLTLETMLIHESGEYITGIGETPLSKQDPQGVGAAITYMRRFSLSAYSGLAQEDDDGNTASSQNTDRAQRSTPAPSKPNQPKVPAVVIKRADETPPPMSDTEVFCAAFTLDDDDTPEWMLSNNITVDDTPPPKQSAGTYHYKFPAPYKQKERAKELGLKWNKERYTWDSKTEIDEFSKWLEGVTE